VRQEAARAETARQEAQRQEAARQRQEATRQEAARQEAAKLEAARTAAARLTAERDAAAARREAALQEIGRQLSEAAARREAAANAARLPSTLPAASSLRRGRLWGRSDANAELVQYAEAFARRIQLNPTIDKLREAMKQRHTQPLVTVAIRSDGTVEAITFVVASGVPELDEAIRDVVQTLAPYPPFPPALAREYDVIEIRRTWQFDTAIRLF
jgi:TonB family protein